MTLNRGPGRYSGPLGPFDSEDQARTHPAVRAVYEAMRDGPRGVMQVSGEAMMLDACDRAGVTPGKYDARIIRWLAGFEPQTCAVIAGLIARAHADGAAEQPDEGQHARCVQCGGPIVPTIDPYNGAPRWRHVPRADPVAEFLDADHGAEPRQDGAS